jgi:acyl carrier protein
MKPTEQRLIRLAAEHFRLQPASIGPGDDIFEALGIDSVQVLELLSELEMRFEVEIPDWELREVRTFAELAEQIDRRLGPAGAGS